MTWMLHMIMELWLKGTINHFLLPNELYDSLLMPIWNICFLQKANLYLNYSIAKRKAETSHWKKSLIVEENSRNKLASSRMRKATRWYHSLFHVICCVKGWSAKLQTAVTQLSDGTPVLLSVYFPISWTLSCSTCRFMPATDPEHGMARAGEAQPHHARLSTCAPTTPPPYHTPPHLTTPPHLPHYALPT